MELWQTVTAAILGNAVVLAVLGWLAKSLIEKMAARDSKRFEIEIKAKADSASHTQKEKTDAWIEGWNALRTQVPPVRTQLEEEFRSLLSPGT